MTTNGTAQIGDTAPDFTLLDVQQQKWNLRANLGSVVALLFYPGDETLVCTQQLCSLRDNWAKYLDTGAKIIGISPGSGEVHRRFADRHNLPLLLLTDENRSITKNYGAHWLFPIWATRAVVVIDAKGIVRYRNVMVRALKPSDYEVLTEIYKARYDDLVERRSQF